MGPVEWDERYLSPDRVVRSGPNLFVEDRLKQHHPGQGLDLAAGEGRNSIWLSGLGWRMTAVDFSEVAVERGRRKAPAIDYRVGDARDWEPEGSFDLLLIAYLHLPPEDFEAVVRRSVRWLAPGGEAFLIGHDVSNLDDGWGGPQSREILWEVSRISEWLGDLTVVEASIVRRPVEGEDEVLYARDTLVRAQVSPRTPPS